LAHNLGKPCTVFVEARLLGQSAPPTYLLGERDRGSKCPLEPLGLFLRTILHTTVYMAYSECLPTRLNPLAESQPLRQGQPLRGPDSPRHQEELARQRLMKKGARGRGAIQAAEAPPAAGPARLSPTPTRALFPLFTQKFGQRHDRPGFQSVVSELRRWLRFGHGAGRAAGPVSRAVHSREDAGEVDPVTPAPARFRQRLPPSNCSHHASLQIAMD
jgi:hypothetical protein